MLNDELKKLLKKKKNQPRSTSIFLAIKLFINSIKSLINLIEFNKHLILDISSSNWIFFVSRAHQSTIYCQISILVFLNLLNQFFSYFLGALTFSSHNFFFFWILLFLVRIYILILGREKLNLGNNPKIGYDTNLKNKLIKKLE
jgi:hypothetical protein